MDGENTGISRVNGETMVVLMVAGVAGISNGIFDPIRPLTANIAAEMPRRLST